MNVSNIKEKTYSHSCSLPWTSLIVDPMGVISFCCFHPAIANVNNISENAMDEIWNGRVVQDLRKRWNEGRLEGTPCAGCQGLHRYKKYDHAAKNIPNLLNEANNPFYSNAELNLDEFSKGKTILKSMPVEITYVPSILCNINCIHCFQAPNRKKCDLSRIKPDALLKFYEYLGSKAVKNVFSGGEPLLMGEVQTLLDEISPEQKASSEGVFLTNGMLIRDRYELTKGFRKRNFIISIDAFEKKRYESIQRGANFEKLIDNLEFLNKRREEGNDITLTLVMVLMKSNFIDLENVFEFAKTYKFDEIWIPPVGNLENRTFVSEGIFKLPCLLEKIPSWEKILEKASQKAKELGYESAHNHLEYIKGMLPSSAIVSYCRSIKNYLLWRIKTIMRSIPAMEKSLKLILKIKFFRKIYKKFY